MDDKVMILDINDTVMMWDLNDSDDIRYYEWCKVWMI